MKSFWVLITIFLLAAASLKLEAAEPQANLRDPAQVVQSYLRATYARDYIEAYRYVSTADQRVRDLSRYAQQRGAFMGFALEASRKLASFIEISALQQASAQLFDLDPRRLNALAVEERRQLIESWEKKRRDGTFETIETEEKLDLVKENEEWRIFLNWAAGVKIPFRLGLASAKDLDASLSKSEAVVQPGDFFEIVLKVTNRSTQPVVARVGHLVEPREVSNFIDFVECGFLLPITLQPGKEQEYFARYLLRGGLPEGVHQLNLTYDFSLLK
jgi:hypothetical protein